MTRRAAMARRAAFFDMDNTLLRVDTGMSWTKFLYRRGELPPSMVAKAMYWSALYKLALLDMEAVVTRLCLDLRGDSEDEMIAKCDVWYRAHVAPEVAPAARVAIEHHRAGGRRDRARDRLDLLRGAPRRARRRHRARAVDRARGRRPTRAFTGRPSALCFGHHKVDARRGVGRAPRHRARGELRSTPTATTICRCSSGSAPRSRSTPTPGCAGTRGGAAGRCAPGAERAAAPPSAAEQAGLGVADRVGWDVEHREDRDRGRGAEDVLDPRVARVGAGAVVPRGSRSGRGTRSR